MPLLFGQADVAGAMQSPIVWALAVAAVGLWIALQGSARSWRRVGNFLGIAGLIGLAALLPRWSSLATPAEWTEQIVFWLLSGVAVISSAAAITSRNPVYSAIWFAASLLGVGGLFLFLHAQFLGVATIVVYAGAIVVTFLFVLMLANPEGHAHYDRISWAKFPAPVLILAITCLFGLTVTALLEAPPARSSLSGAPVESPEHMARFGGELFARHLVSVEVAGTILLVALVGAIAIVIQGREERRRSE